MTTFAIIFGYILVGAGGCVVGWKSCRYSMRDKIRTISHKVETGKAKVQKAIDDNQ